MDLIAGTLILVGFVVFLFGGLLFLIAAFRESIWWGLACLLLPIVQFFYLIVHWPEAKKPFLIQMFAVVIIVIGIILNPQTLHH